MSMSGGRAFQMEERKHAKTLRSTWHVRRGTRRPVRLAVSG